MGLDHVPTQRCISITLATLSFIIFVMNLALITGSNIGLERLPITRKYKPPGNSINQVSTRYLMAPMRMEANMGRNT